MSPRHLGGASDLLRACFEGSVWDALGESFVQQFLDSFVSQQNGAAFVATCGDRIVGFIVGADDASRHRSDFLRRRWLRLMTCVLIRLSRTPHVAWKLRRYAGPYLSTVRNRITRRKETSESDEIPRASLILLGVEVGHRRQGIAERLTRVFLEEMGSRGIRRVKLVVGRENGPALRFYLSQGWQQAGLHPTPDGGSAYRLIYNLEGSGQG